MKTNCIYHGDCKFVLNHDISPNSIDLIYLDPPFFTGKTQKGSWQPGAMEVSYEDSKKFWGTRIGEGGALLADTAPLWIRSVAYKRPEFASYLYYMMQRLEECKKVLKNTGSIYLHCDYRASHYLKMVMDWIFGAENFKNEIVWYYKTGGLSKRYFGRKHDIILFYTKTNKYIFNQIKEPRPESEKSNYKEIDENGRRFTWWAQPGTKSGGKEGKKIYFDEGTILRDVWELAHINQVAKERLGYPTQKPESLLERIIKASSNVENVVLDPFCGCGTAIVVAKKLNRKWIGIDVNMNACKVMQSRFENDFGMNIIMFERDVDEVKRFDASKFEKWVNDFFGATKPYPDKGVDGITTEGIPIQTKKYKVDYDVISQFLTDAKFHSKVPKPFREGIIVSQVGFTSKARSLINEIKEKEGIKINLVTPEELLITYA